MRHSALFVASLLTLAACQGSNAVSGVSGTQGLAGAASTAGSIRTGVPMGTFSIPNVAAKNGPPNDTWIFASNGEGGNIDVYDAAKLTMISQCTCSGVGLAVDPGTDDLAVGSKSGTVTVWHVKKKQITQFATLNLSQGPYAIGLAYDNKGDLYAGNSGDNVIDFFTASEILAGGGPPTRTLFTSNLNEVEYLAAAGKKLVADGYNRYGQPILVEVNTTTGADTILQMPPSGQLPEGIAFDRHRNLIFNTIGDQNAILVYSQTWTGSPAVTFDYGSGASSGYYSGISLDKKQDTLWAGNFTYENQSHALTNLQANSYPLGTVGGSTILIGNEYYDSIAADPQGK